MARKWGKVDYKELALLRNRLLKFQRVDMDAFCSKMAKEIAARLLRRVKQRTPVGVYEPISYTKKDGTVITFNDGKQGGKLRRRWNVEKNVTKDGVVYKIEVFNPLEYASYVEYGHRQEVGRFVPQIGKKLTSPWVGGQFMLTISEEEIQSIAPRLLEKKLDAELRRIFNA